VRLLPLREIVRIALPPLTEPKKGVVSHSASANAPATHASMELPYLCGKYMLKFLSKILKNKQRVVEVKKNHDQTQISLGRWITKNSRKSRFVLDPFSP
jgi:hypothetical protein